MSDHGDLACLADPVAQSLLTSTIPARLSYTWTDGTPRVVPIWFHWDGTQMVFGTPPRAPKLHALEDGAPVAVTIDTNEWPYKVLSIRGTARVEHVEGVIPEYAAAAKRYFGDEQGQAWVDQFPPGMEMWRIAVTPTWANVLDFETRFPSALSA
jgi:pyridoxamine 5'-phosphate oxidase-like protein